MMQSNPHQHDIFLNEFLNSSYNGYVPSSIRASYFAFLALVMVVGVPGNTIIIIIYMRTRPKTVCDWLILFIGIMDFLVCLMSPGLYLRTELGATIPKINGVLCALEQFFQLSAMISSCFLLDVIALERYLRVCHPSLITLTANGSRNACFGCCAVAIAICVYPIRRSFSANECHLMVEARAQDISFSYLLFLFVIFAASFVLVPFAYGSVINTIAKKIRIKQKITKNDGLRDSSKSKGSLNGSRKSATPLPTPVTKYRPIPLNVCPPSSDNTALDNGEAYVFLNSSHEIAGFPNLIERTSQLNLSRNGSIKMGNCSRVNSLRLHPKWPAPQLSVQTAESDRKYDQLSCQPNCLTCFDQNADQQVPLPSPEDGSRTDCPIGSLAKESPFDTMCYLPSESNSSPTTVLYNSSPTFGFADDVDSTPPNFFQYPSVGSENKGCSTSLGNYHPILSGCDVDTPTTVQPYYDSHPDYKTSAKNTDGVDYSPKSRQHLDTDASIVLGGNTGFSQGDTFSTQRNEGMRNTVSANKPAPCCRESPYSVQCHAQMAGGQTPEGHKLLTPTPSITDRRSEYSLFNSSFKRYRWGSRHRSEKGSHTHSSLDVTQADDESNLDSPSVGQFLKMAKKKVQHRLSRGSSGRTKRWQRERQMTFMLLSVTAVFLLSWIPPWALYLSYMYDIRWTNSEVVTRVLFRLSDRVFLVNYMSNFLIYYAFNISFRKKVKSMLKLPPCLEHFRCWRTKLPSDNLAGKEEVKVINENNMANKISR